jgi:tripartite motif-containing protein 71
MGNFYVADRNNHRMQKFTGGATFLTKWGSFGTGEGEFNLPYAVRARGNGFIYVSDSSNHRVQKFGVTASTGIDVSFWMQYR